MSYKITVEVVKETNLVPVTLNIQDNGGSYTRVNRNSNTSFVIEALGAYVGYTGSRGIDGASASIGYTGSTGFTGSIGFTGSAGVSIQGETGFTGSAGTIGIDGEQGPRGYTGSAGIQGEHGLTGYNGSKGDIGNNGPRGFTGSAGADGASAGIGYTGSAGSSGEQGPRGFTGSRGDIGSSGDVGFTGSIGTTGFTGSVGEVGFTGSAGAQGVAGFIGSRGFTGSNGTIGFTGSQGSIGFTGSAGTTGFTGSMGPQGPPGSGSDGSAGSISSLRGEWGVPLKLAEYTFDDETVPPFVFSGTPSIITDPDIISGTTKAISLPGVTQQEGGDLEYLEFNCVAGGEFNILHLRYHLQSETNYDFFRIWVDGVQVFQQSGIFGYQSYNLTLEPGEHLIRLAFQVDRNTTAGHNNVHFSKISFPVEDTDLSYNYGDTVRYNNSTWLCLVSGTEQEPGVGTDWVDLESGTVSKFTASIGNGLATSFNLNHNFGTRDVNTTIYRLSDYQVITANVTMTTINQVTVSFEEAPTSNQYRVVVIG